MYLIYKNWHWWITVKKKKRNSCCFAPTPSTGLIHMQVFCQPKIIFPEVTVYVPALISAMNWIHAFAILLHGIQTKFMPMLMVFHFGHSTLKFCFWPINVRATYFHRKRTDIADDQPLTFITVAHLWIFFSVQNYVTGFKLLPDNLHKEIQRASHSGTPWGGHHGDKQPFTLTPIGNLE